MKLVPHREFAHVERGAAVVKLANLRCFLLELAQDRGDLSGPPAASGVRVISR